MSGAVRTLDAILPGAEKLLAGRVGLMLVGATLAEGENQSVGIMVPWNANLMKLMHRSGIAGRTFALYFGDGSVAGGTAATAAQTTTTTATEVSDISATGISTTGKKVTKGSLLAIQTTGGAIPNFCLYVEFQIYE